MSRHLLRFAARLSAAGFTAVLSMASMACSSATTGAAEAPHAPTVAPVVVGTVQADSAAPARGNSPATQTPADPALPLTFSGQEAFRHVRHLAEAIGIREAGGAKEREAARYIEGQFALNGYQARQEPFQFEMYEARSSSLQANASGAASIANSPLYFSQGGKVTGPVVRAGIGRPEDFPPGGLKGVVALVERGTLTFVDKVANAAAAGAAGVVVYNNVAGRFDGNLGRAGSTIPAVSIAKEDGDRLAGLLAAGRLEVTLEVDAGKQQLQSQNVVAQAGDGCRVVIGGHYDSVAAGPGANDNASGTGVVVELARVMKPVAAAKQLCFVAFGSEELGLWGSRRYVEALAPAEKTAVVAMINLDMVGVGETWRLFGSDSLSDPALASAHAAGAVVDGFSSEGRGSGGGSDHASFIQAGVPAVFIHRQNDPNYHTPEDKPEFTNPDLLETAGKIAVELVNRLVSG